MLDRTASGLYVIAVTPFGDDGQLDEASIEPMVAFYRRCGAAGLTVLGVMGEAPKLGEAEALGFAAQVVRAAAPLPVVVGVSAPGFAAMRALAQGAMRQGAAGVMIAPPAGLRSDDRIVSYFQQAVAAIGDDVPFAIQDFPQLTGVVLEPSLIRRIVEALPSCVMLKHEDWPGLEKISALRRYQAEGSMRPLAILAGNGAAFLDFEIARGADGAMTGYSFPDMLAELIRLLKASRREEAQDLFEAHLPLLRYEQQPGPGLAVRKLILKARGAIASDAQRAPASTLTPDARREVAYLLQRLAARDQRAAGLADRVAPGP